MDVILVILHYADAEIGAQFYGREYLFDDVLHFVLKQALPVLADEDDMTLEIPFVPAALLICIFHIRYFPYFSFENTPPGHCHLRYFL